MGTPEKGKIAVQAVLFDLDGTLIDSIGVYYTIVSATLKELGMPGATMEAVYDATENGSFDWYKILPAAIESSHPGIVDRAWEIAARISPRMFREGVSLIPGCAEQLQRIVKSGLTAAIVTSTPRRNISAKLEPFAQQGLAHLFKAVINADDTDRVKPAGDPLIECCRRINTAPAKCVYIGDTRTDIQAGKAAGTYTVGVLTGFDDQDTLRAERPDAVIDSISELHEVVLLDASVD